MFCLFKPRRKEPGSVGGGDFLSHLGSDQRPGGKLTEHTAGNRPFSLSSPAAQEEWAGAGAEQPLLGDGGTSAGESLGKKREKGVSSFLNSPEEIIIADTLLTGLGEFLAGWRHAFLLRRAPSRCEQASTQRALGVI